MEINVTWSYIYTILFLWLSPVICAVWGGPIYGTVCLMCAFAIYAGHEWIHVWICKINNLDVAKVNLATGGKTCILFGIEENAKDRKTIEGKVYLAGVVYDSILMAIAVFSCYGYALYMNDLLPLTIGSFIIILLIFNLASPGSDWQNYLKRTSMRV